jgi:hypothetical protein
VTNFDDWTQKRFVRWLYKNHPKPEGRWVEVTLNFDLGSAAVEKITMADDYETCIAELAWELELHNRSANDLPESFKKAFPETEAECNFTFLIRPAKRRKKKQKWLRIPSKQND